MKELEYTHHEDVALQHLIDEEKPIYDKYRKKFRELAEEFYEEFHKKRKENFRGFNHRHVCSFKLSCANEKEAHKCCREYLRQIGKEDTIEIRRYGFLNLKNGYIQIIAIIVHTINICFQILMTMFCLFMDGKMNLRMRYLVSRYELLYF